MEQLHKPMKRKSSSLCAWGLGNGDRYVRAGSLAKRAFDILASAMGLFVSLPIWIIIAIAIYLKTGRPAFFCAGTGR